VKIQQMLEPNFSPFTEIVTGRLILSRITKQDAPQLFHLRSNDKVMQYIDKEKFKTIAQTEALINRIDDDLNNNNGITWRISLKEKPGTLVGTIGFWRMIKENYRAEVGYMLHYNLWGRGITKEALQAVIDFGFNNIKLHSIEAHINPGNIASAKLLQSTGFVQEAYFKEDYFFRGAFLDTAVYCLLNKFQVSN
jgi:[ribosomal protein S5]-alanine N-acetyltransferase